MFTRSLIRSGHALKLGKQVRVLRVRRFASSEFLTHPIPSAVKTDESYQVSRMNDFSTLTAKLQSRRLELYQSSSLHQSSTALSPKTNSLPNNCSVDGNKFNLEKVNAQRIRAAKFLLRALLEEARTVMSMSKGPAARHFSSDTRRPRQSDKQTTRSTTELDLGIASTGKEGASEAKEDFLAQFKLPDSVPTQPEDSQAEAEEYRSLRSQQITDLGKAREKTAANVRRALAGNVFICMAKLGAWLSSGSSSMLSELVHSIVDCGNQSLLLVGLRDAENKADRKHPYGYGKSIYFWALVSALGTFFLGAGVSMTHAVGELLEPSLQSITWEVWGVLGLSLTVDGYVFGKTIAEIYESKPADKTMWEYIQNLRDPATLAILLEDGAACLGVVMALAGISAAHVSGMPVFDGLAGVGISGLLASMGLVLVRVNHRFLLGQAVDRDITEGIEKILLSQRSIDNVQSVQSQWTSSETFSYKAEVDFDGTYLAAKLMPRYQREFLEVKDTLDQDLRVLLSWYAEDVIRTVEREVRHSETEIRRKYPGAEYIELEPMSKDADRFAIDDGMEARLRKLELVSLNYHLKALYQKTPTVAEKECDTTANPEGSDGTPKLK